MKHLYNLNICIINLNLFHVKSAIDLFSPLFKSSSFTFYYHINLLTFIASLNTHKRKLYSPIFLIYSFLHKHLLRVDSLADILLSYSLLMYFNSQQYFMDLEAI